MREFWIEIGRRNEDGYNRIHSEHFLARTNDEAILIANEVADKAEGRRDATMALLLDNRSAVVRAWELDAFH